MEDYKQTEIEEDIILIDNKSEINSDNKSENNKLKIISNKDLILKKRKLKTKKSDENLNKNKYLDKLPEYLFVLKDKVFTILANNLIPFVLVLISIYFSLCVSCIEDKNPMKLVKKIANITLLNIYFLLMVIIFIGLLSLRFNEKFMGKINQINISIFKFIFRDLYKNPYFYLFTNYLFDINYFELIHQIIIFITLVTLINLPGIVDDDLIDNMYFKIINFLIPLVYCGILFPINKIVEVIDNFIIEKIKDEKIDFYKIKYNYNFHSKYIPDIIKNNFNQYSLINNVLLYLITSIPMHCKNIYNLKISLLLFIGTIFSNNICDWLAIYNKEYDTLLYQLIFCCLEAVICIITTALSCLIANENKNLFDKNNSYLTLIIMIIICILEYKYIYNSRKKFYYKSFNRLKNLIEIEDLYFKIVNIDEEKKTVKIKSNFNCGKESIKTFNFDELEKISNINFKKKKSINKEKVYLIKNKKFEINIYQIINEIFDDFLNGKFFKDCDVNFQPTSIFFDILFSTETFSEYNCCYTSEFTSICKIKPSYICNGKLYCKDHIKYVQNEKENKNDITPFFFKKCDHKELKVKEDNTDISSQCIPCDNFAQFFEEEVNESGEITKYKYLCLNCKNKNSNKIDEISNPVSDKIHNLMYLKFSLIDTFKKNELNIKNILTCDVFDSIDNNLLIELINEYDKINNFKDFKIKIKQKDIDIATLNKLKIIKDFKFILEDKKNNNNKIFIELSIIKDKSQIIWEIRFTKENIKFLLNNFINHNIKDNILNIKDKDNKFNKFDPILKVQIKNKNKDSTIVIDNLISDKKVNYQNVNTDSLNQAINEIDDENEKIIKEIKDEDIIKNLKICKREKNLIREMLDSYPDYWNLFFKINNIRKTYKERFFIIMEIITRNYNQNNIEDAKKDIKNVIQIFDNLVMIICHITFKLLEKISFSKLNKSDKKIKEILKSKKEFTILIFKYILPLVSITKFKNIFNNQKKKFTADIEKIHQKVIKIINKKFIDQKFSEKEIQILDFAQKVKLQKISSNSETLKLHLALNEIINLISNNAKASLGLIGYSNCGKSTVIQNITGRESTSIGSSAETAVITKKKMIKTKEAKEDIIINVPQNIYKILRDFIENNEDIQVPIMNSDGINRNIKIEKKRILKYFKDNTCTIEIKPTIIGIYDFNTEFELDTDDKKSDFYSNNDNIIYYSDTFENTNIYKKLKNNIDFKFLKFNESKIERLLNKFKNFNIVNISKNKYELHDKKENLEVIHDVDYNCKIILNILNQSFRNFKNNSKNKKEISDIFKESLINPIEIIIEIPNVDWPFSEKDKEFIIYDLIGIADEILNYHDNKEMYYNFLNDITQVIVVNTPDKEGTSLLKDLKDIIKHDYIYTLLNKKDNLEDERKIYGKGLQSKLLKECLKRNFKENSKDNFKIFEFIRKNKNIIERNIKTKNIKISGSQQTWTFISETLYNSKSFRKNADLLYGNLTKDFIYLQRRKKYSDDLNDYIDDDKLKINELLFRFGGYWLWQILNEAHDNRLIVYKKRKNEILNKLLKKIILIIDEIYYNKTSKDKNHLFQYLDNIKTKKDRTKDEETLNNLINNKSKKDLLILLKEKIDQKAIDKYCKEKQSEGLKNVWFFFEQYPKENYFAYSLYNNNVKSKTKRIIKEKIKLSLKQEINKIKKILKKVFKNIKISNDINNKYVDDIYNSIESNFKEWWNSNNSKKPASPDSGWFAAEYPIDDNIKLVDFICETIRNNNNIYDEFVDIFLNINIISQIQSICFSFSDDKTKEKDLKLILNEKWKFNNKKSEKKSEKNSDQESNNSDSKKESEVKEKSEIKKESEVNQEKPKSTNNKPGDEFIIDENGKKLKKLNENVRVYVLESDD